MKKCYINGLGCISAQKSFGDGFLDEPILYTEENILRVVKPEYKDFISPAAVRRMSSGVKNGIVASKMAMNEASAEMPDAIITGTGMGCMQDSEKFLNNMIQHDEEYLTPTSFIQSTHNTVGGQIALGLKCKGYNYTYVNTAVSFQSALIDGLMQIQESDSEQVLIGGIEELAEHTSILYKLIEYTKSDESAPYNIFENRTKGCVSGEGASFFVLERNKTDNTYCELTDVTFRNQIEQGKIPDFLNKFLKKNNLEINDIDAVLLGNNGDIDFDHYYDDFEKIFSETDFLVYKHLFGDFMTSSSIALWLASKIIKTNSVPAVLTKNNLEKQQKEYKNILIYNQYRGKDHSLILLNNV
ncbi:MAG: beta-ketoacyl synthase N-terminal-like domain-containing protein [Brumimicrobium sp.]